jgi:hypothetical protein
VVIIIMEGVIQRGVVKKKGNKTEESDRERIKIR